MAFGRYVSEGDMTVLVTNPGRVATENASAFIPGASFVTKTTWSPKNPQFELLNTVTDRDRFVFFTVTCQLQLEFISEPILLNCVCRAKVFRQDENFWLPTDRRPCMEDISLQIVEVTGCRSFLKYCLRDQSRFFQSVFVGSARNPGCTIGVL